jgi:MerR family transcriptional regulator, redox-sensitive transcriptional activator SoxR
VRHGIKRRKVIDARHRRAQPSALLIEGEREKRAALALHAQRPLERLAIEVAIEVDEHCLGLALDTRHAAGQKHIAGALLTLADLIKRTAGDLCNGLVKGVTASRGVGHGSLLSGLVELLCIFKSGLSQVTQELLIGEVARRAGIRPSAIRYYESIGLLPEPARIAGRRRYTAEIVRTLSIIGAAQRAGLTLDDVRELLAASDTNGGVSEPLRAIAKRKLPEIDALIERARLVRGWLEAAAECRCPTLEDCPLFDERG